MGTTAVGETVAMELEIVNNWHNAFGVHGLTVLPSGIKVGFLVTEVWHSQRSPLMPF